MGKVMSSKYMGSIFEKYPHIDPVTFQVISSGLESICREMGTTMVRTAYSPIFVDGQDFSCAILDDISELVATANYDPSHLSAMSYASEWAVMEIGYDDLKPGDVIIHNDPYRGGTHLADFTVIKPVYYKDQLLAMAVSRAHHLDVGGKSIGGFPGDATEIYAEGFRLPPVRWYKEGVEQHDIFDTLLLNVRIPWIQVGDFKAQLASAITAENRLIEFCEKYGIEAVKETMQARKDYSEKRMRAEISEIPDGKYIYEDFMDDDGPTDRPYKIKTTVTIDGSDMTVDYTGSSRQAIGPVNAAYGMTASSTFNALLQLMDKDVPFNHGCFRPVTIIAPRGTIVNPNPPAPVFGGVTDTSIRIIDVIIGALAKAIPNKVIAATYGTCNNFTGGGYDSERKTDYVFYFFSEGGWGAASYRDGWNCTPNQTSNFKDYPVEIIESEFPLMCEGVELYQDSAGPGKFRGGFGTIRKLKLLGEKALANGLGERHKFQPYGLYGGKPAKSNALLVKRDGENEFKTFQEAFDRISPSKFADIPLKKDDVVAFVMTGGGGYGNPFERDTEMVLKDVREELVSLKSAREDYGVEIIFENGEYKVDFEETKKLREEVKEEQNKNVINGCITVDDYSMKARDLLKDEDTSETEETKDIEVRMKQAWEKINKDYCKNKCSKKGHFKKCPFHNEEASRFWCLDAISIWSERNCPLNIKI